MQSDISTFTAVHARVTRVMPSCFCRNIELLHRPCVPLCLPIVTPACLPLADGTSCDPAELADGSHCSVSWGGIAVCIATRYGLDGPGVEFGGG
jgi:hypothetical protein